MKVNFRQGIVSAQFKPHSLTDFIVQGASGYVDLIANEKSVTVNFAFGQYNYITKTIRNQASAWGSFIGNTSKQWLYWDIRTRDAVLTTGSTKFQPVVSSIAPTNPPEDQHWFDLNTTTMKVWLPTSDGGSWIPKIRAFAGTYENGVVIANQVGSQVSLNGDVSAGYIMFDDSMLPMRLSNGAFFTSDKQSHVNFLPIISTVKLDQNMMIMEAVESIPKFSLVTVSGSDKIALAQTSDVTKLAIGIAEDATYPGDMTNVVFRGLVQNTDWSINLDIGIQQFSEVHFGKLLYLSHNGKLSFNRALGTSQKIGTVINENSVYIDIDEVTNGGPAGQSGSQGPQGPTGADGADGAQGQRSRYTFSDTAPVSPAPDSGDKWYNTSIGVEFVWFEDGDSNQWISVSGPTGAPGRDGTNGADSTIAGPKGDTGDTGPKGDTGNAGPAGADSTVIGPQGPQGPAGAAGAGGSGGGGPSDELIPLVLNYVELTDSAMYTQSDIPDYSSSDALWFTNWIDTPYNQSQLLIVKDDALQFTNTHTDGANSLYTNQVTRYAANDLYTQTSSADLSSDQTTNVGTGANSTSYTVSMVFDSSTNRTYVLSKMRPNTSVVYRLTVLDAALTEVMHRDINIGSYGESNEMYINPFDFAIYIYNASYPGYSVYKLNKTDCTYAVTIISGEYLGGTYASGGFVFTDADTIITVIKGLPAIIKITAQTKTIIKKIDGTNAGVETVFLNSAASTIYFYRSGTSHIGTASISSIYQMAYTDTVLSNTVLTINPGAANYEFRTYDEFRNLIWIAEETAIQINGSSYAQITGISLTDNTKTYQIRTYGRINQVTPGGDNNLNYLYEIVPQIVATTNDIIILTVADNKTTGRYQIDTDIDVKQLHIIRIAFDELG